MIEKIVAEQEAKEKASKPAAAEKVVEEKKVEEEKKETPQEVSIPKTAVLEEKKSVSPAPETPVKKSKAQKRKEAQAAKEPEAKKAKKFIDLETFCTSSRAVPVTSKPLPGGLGVDVLMNGTPGKMACLGKKATIRYCAKHEGRTFAKGTQALNLGLRESLDGLDAGVKGMLVGEIRRLHIPAHLAYGAEGDKEFKIPP